MPGTTQRPFFANFLAAFRAHAPTPPTPTSTTTSTNTASAAAAAATLWSSQRPTAPQTTSTTTNSTPSPSAPQPAQPIAINAKTPASAFEPLNPYHASRRNSSSSTNSSGFRGAELPSSPVAAQTTAWFIGGRAGAGGEERYYKLGVARRERSVDRISADRLSL